MDLYMRSVSNGFLLAAIQDTIIKLLEAKQSCEVNFKLKTYLIIFYKKYFKK